MPLDTYLLSSKVIGHRYLQLVEYGLKGVGSQHGRNIIQAKEREYIVASPF